MRASFAFASVLSAALAFPVLARAAEIMVGYVVLQRCLSEIEDGKRAKAKLKRIFDKKQKQLNEKQNALKRFEDDLRKESVILKDEAKRKKAEEYMSRRQELMQLYMALQKDLAKQEADITKPILAKLSKLLGDIGHEQDFTFILEKTDSGLVFAKPALDLSNELIRRYNDRFGRK
jgi:outer membrane protein